MGDFFFPGRVSDKFFFTFTLIAGTFLSLSIFKIINTLPSLSHLHGLGSKFLFPLKLDRKTTLSFLLVNIFNSDILQNGTVSTFSSW